jgi:hypothetical protein
MRKPQHGILCFLEQLQCLVAIRFIQSILHYVLQGNFGGFATFMHDTILGSTGKGRHSSILEQFDADLQKLLCLKHWQWHESCQSYAFR